MRDTLCGTLATSKVLHTLRTMRVAQIGERIDFFWSCVVSEADLLQKFGVQVLPVDLAGLLRQLEKLVGDRQASYEREATELAKLVDTAVYPDRRLVLYNFVLRDRLLELAEEQRLDGFSLKSFFSIQEQLGSSLSLGVAMLNDLGYPVAPESDVHGAISSILAEAATTKDEPSFLADVTTRHPANDNAVLLWHAEAPLSLRHPTAKAKVGRSWILKGLAPGLLHFQLKDGPLT